jgi:hypothetical protein
MAYIKLDGFNEFKKDLERLSKRASELNGEHTFTFEELFPDSFIQKHTQFSTIDELFENGGFKINSEEDFDALPEDKLDQHISATTDFDCWKDMLGSAAEEYMAKELGF